MEKEFFSKKYTNAVKGIAIILMVSLHLLQKRWMPDSSMIVDFRLDGVPISSIVAYACDTCIGIFAFITGYGWATSFNRKSFFERIWPLYQTYWVVLILFAFPARAVTELVVNSNSIDIGLKEIVLSILGIRSHAVMF